MEGCAKKRTYSYCAFNMWYCFTIYFFSSVPSHLTKTSCCSSWCWVLVEVMAAGMQGDKRSKNPDNSDLLSLLHGTGQYTCKDSHTQIWWSHFCFTKFPPEAKEVGAYIGITPKLGFWLETSILTETSALSAFHSKDSGAFNCSETMSHRFASGNTVGKRFPSWDLTQAMT